MDFKKIGFIGLGLIGGSLAKTIKRIYPETELIATSDHLSTITAAFEDHTISNDTLLAMKDFSDCDIIFLCCPVQKNIEYIKELKPFLKKGCILSDVGSVKGDIHESITALELESFFIGGHPMAGSEKTGYQAATAYLLENAYYILTPTAKTDTTMLHAFRDYIASLGSVPMIMDAKTHDHATASISHLPHIIAATLVNYVKDSDTKSELMKRLAAGGFKDITRIASSSPIMWQNICLKNKDNIVDILDQYIDSLEDFKEAIEREDDLDLYNRFESSRNYRNSMPSSSAGPIKKTFAVYCDIIDEAGGIAAIATILASNNISIKNIGIVHNREFEEGVLRIEFYDEDSSKRAVGLLQKFRYIVYER